MTYKKLSNYQKPLYNEIRSIRRIVRGDKFESITDFSNTLEGLAPLLFASAIYNRGILMTRKALKDGGVI